MKFTNSQFTEAAFIFEMANGNIHSDYEKEVIATSRLTQYPPTTLENIIIEGLNSELYKNEDERVSAYWALSKIGNQNLIVEFQKWLYIELQNEKVIAIFQLLVALDRLEEPAFHKSRNGRGVNEIELNIRDAKQYLKLS